MTDVTPRVLVPATVLKGAVFAVKTVVTHPMETGLRVGPDGKAIPRLIINKFTCRYDGAEVFVAELHEAVAANPYIEFEMRAMQSGALEFTWEEDGGAIYRLQHRLTVL